MPIVQEKGQVTLAAGLRQEIGIRPGDDIEELLLRPGQAAPAAGILVVPRRSGMARFRGMLGQGSTDLTLADMRE